VSEPIRIAEFGGLIPMLSDKMLPTNCAVDAINCDLTGKGIRPMYAPLFKASVDAGAGIPYASAIHQIPVVAYKVASLNTAAYVEFVPVAGLPNVGANDRLYYAVYIPAAPAPVAGQGCINIQFSDGSTLGAGINDSAGRSAIAGNLTAFAGGWLLRSIPLGGQLTSAGAAITGKTISKVRLFQNHASATARAAYYAYVFVWDPVADLQRGALLDCDLQKAPSGTSGSFVIEAGWNEVDEDEFVLVSGDSLSNLNSTADMDSIVSLAYCPMSGIPRRKVMVARANVIGNQQFLSVFGRSNHNHAYSFVTISTDTLYKRFVSAGTNVGVLHQSSVTSGANSNGWVGVAAPTVALPVPAVVGGAGPAVTRAYVVTNVSEDGLESAPSPAVTQTGNSTGGASWNFAAIPLWNGVDKFCGESGGAGLLARRRIYRTPEGSSKYHYVGELDYNDTAFNDAVLDANLGEELETVDYLEPPAMQSIASWNDGLVGALVGGTELAFCVPYRYHAWPLSYRYTLAHFGVAVASTGDHFVVLTKNRPILFSGTDPENLLDSEVEEGEACISAKAVIDSDIGVIYPGATGWGLLTPGYQHLTKGYLRAADYLALVSTSTVSMFDNRRLYWITQGATQGYMLELGAAERALVKFEVASPIQAMSYYAPRDSRWYAYTSGSLQIGKLFGDTSQKLKWTWKSKLLHLPAATRLKVAKVESSEWDSLSNDMAYREGFYRTDVAWVTATAYNVGDFRTQGGHKYRCDVAHTSGVFATDLAALKWILTDAIYSIDTTGLTQAEAWCYLKVWADADKSAKKTLVFDDFVVSDKPVRLGRVMKSDCYQFEVRGNVAIEAVSLAGTESDLKQE
jgi:hypothetical protein